MKKLLSTGVISLALLAGSAFAFTGQDRTYDWEYQQRHARVVRVNDDRDHHRRHARIYRTYNGRRVWILRHRHHRHQWDERYYDRHHRMP
jgi:hypothetical protein